MTKVIRTEITRCSDCSYASESHDYHRCKAVSDHKILIHKNRDMGAIWQAFKIPSWCPMLDKRLETIWTSDEPQQATPDVEAEDFHIHLTMNSNTDSYTIKVELDDGRSFRTVLSRDVLSREIRQLLDFPTGGENESA